MRVDDEVKSLPHLHVFFHVVGLMEGCCIVEFDGPRGPGTSRVGQGFERIADVAVAGQLRINFVAEKAAIPDVAALAVMPCQRGGEALFFFRIVLKHAEGQRQTHFGPVAETRVFLVMK